MKLIVVLGILLLTGYQAMAQCELPAEFTNSAVVNEADLKVTLATEKAVYAIGETVRFYFIVENEGASTFSINWGIDPQDAIFVMPLSCTAVTQTCYDSAVFVHPQFLFFFSAGTTLAPGECRVWERSWDTTVFPPVPGTYNVLAGMFEPTFDEAIGIFRVPTTPILLNVTIEGTVPVEDGTWGAIKAIYQ